MTGGGVVIGGLFPNPVGWAVDKVTGFVGGVATEGFEVLIGGLVAWVIDAVVWVVGGVFNFFMDATDPNVQADWFSGAGSPYATTATIGATLLVGFVLAGVVQGTLAGDPGGMLKRMAVDLPVSVLAMVGLVTVTQTLIALTDALSTDVMSRFQEDIGQFTTVVSSLSGLGGGPATAFVVLLLGLVTVLAGIVLVAELVVRSMLIYIVVALAPLVFAARVWPALKGSCRKLLELLCALILSKLVIAIALAVASSAAVGAGSGGEVTSLPDPEVAAEDPGGSVTQAVGVLLTATAAFGVSAFTPMVLMRLLPLAEGAMVAQGIRGGPGRAAQQGMSMGYSAKVLSSSTSKRIASAPVGVAGAGGAGAAGAAAGPAGAAFGATKGAGSYAGKRASAAIDTTGKESPGGADGPAGRPPQNQPKAGAPSRKPPAGSDRMPRGGDRGSKGRSGGS